MDLLLRRTESPDGMKGDLVFVNGDTPVTSDLVDRVIQRLFIRLRTFFGEWFLNVGYGVPYLERILGQKVSKTTVDMILQDQIISETGVKEIIEFSSTLEVSTRVYSCSFRVRVTDGNISRLETISL